MKVRELIQSLRLVDPELPVMVRGYEDGVNDVQEMRSIRILRDRNKGTSYYGLHDLAHDGSGESAIELWGDNPKIIEE